jgi:hypothetical protein
MNFQSLNERFEKIKSKKDLREKWNMTSKILI